MPAELLKLNNPDSPTTLHPQLLNRYTYVNNCPLKYTDPTGHFLDWIWDAIAVAYDIYQFFKDPSWSNAGMLGLDVILAIIPFVPAGAGIAAGTVKLADNASSLVTGLNKFLHAGDYGVQTYKNLKKMTKGTDLEAHHLVEVRFAKNLGVKSDNMLCIALTKEEHQKYTNLWRKYIGYGSGTEEASWDKIWEAAQNVYKDDPELLEIINAWLLSIK